MDLEINKEDDYDVIKEKLKLIEEGKYKEFILEKDDIELLYGFTIFDVENKDKNKSLDAIAFCNNLGEDYNRTCNWLVQNTHYYPGLMNLDLKLLVYSKKLLHGLMIYNNKNYINLFSVFFNKEDGFLNSITLKYANNNFHMGNLAKAFSYYFDTIKIKEELNKKNEEIEKRLNDIAVF